MEFFKRLRRAFGAAKAPIYTQFGTDVAQAASTTAIATGISGGAPLAKEKKSENSKDEG